MRVLKEITDWEYPGHTLNETETLIKNIIDAEVERRIYNWEMATV